MLRTAHAVVLKGRAVHTTARLLAAAAVDQTVTAGRGGAGGSGRIHWRLDAAGIGGLAPFRHLGGVVDRAVSCKVTRWRGNVLYIPARQILIEN